jgi:2-oxoglutarate ferredoxin oxidoreductase subunit alpha
MELLEKENISFLHFKQVYPLHPKTSDYLRKADIIVLIENNTTGQFGKLIKLNTGIDVDAKILKSNGLPFSVEELNENLENILLKS